MKILFNKYEGTGNDFIIIRNTPRLIEHSDSRIISWLCDRHFGIGADGLILVEDREGFDFDMVFFNSDGNKSTMCGNGGRSVASYFMHLTGKREVTFIAGDGPHVATMSGDDQVALSINNVKEITETPYGILVNTGVPHLVVFREDIDNLDLISFARPLRHASFFAPAGVNVNVVEISGSGLRVRTFERGVEDETLSCGTGVTASAIAAAYTGKIVTDRVNVSVKGGFLNVSFKLTKEGAEGIRLTGPATFVFSGETDI